MCSNMSSETFSPPILVQYICNLPPCTFPFYVMMFSTLYTSSLITLVFLLRPNHQNACCWLLSCALRTKTKPPTSNWFHQICALVVLLDLFRTIRDNPFFYVVLLLFHSRFNILHIHQLKSSDVFYAFSYVLLFAELAHV